MNKDVVDMLLTAKDILQDKMDTAKEHKDSDDWMQFNFGASMVSQIFGVEVAVRQDKVVLLRREK